MGHRGRVLHRLKSFGPDERNTILFTGYQAEGTLRSDLVNGQKEVRIHGEMVSIRAGIVIMHNLSSHGDCSEILEWLSHLKKTPKKVSLTHGESESALALEKRIEEKFHGCCEIPNYLHSEEL